MKEERKKMSKKSSKKLVVKAKMPTTLYIVKESPGDYVVFTDPASSDLLNYEGHVVGVYNLVPDGIKKIKVVLE